MLSLQHIKGAPPNPPITSRGRLQEDCGYTTERLWEDHKKDYRKTRKFYSKTMERLGRLREDYRKTMRKGCGISVILFKIMEMPAD